jgi:hypothetical protein
MALDKRLPICLSCSQQPCLESNLNQLIICDYGIAFIRTEDKIQRQDPLFSLNYILSNLRHTLNPLLALIVEQLSEIDPKLLKKKINKDNLEHPPYKIYAATIMLDNFIKMVSSVNVYHPLINKDLYLIKKQKLFNLVKRYFFIYSIIKNIKRADNLDLSLENDGDCVILCSDIIELIISILLDNVWKYSISNSKIVISYKRKE